MTDPATDPTDSGADPSGEQVRWSYRPGAWFGVVGEHVGVVVPEVAKDRVAALWESIDGGAAFEEVLDVLVSGGLSGLPGFALVGLGDTTRVLLRGGHVTATVVTAQSEEDVDGSAAGTWVERTFTGVSSLALRLADSDETARAGDLALPGGLVRVSRLDHPAIGPEPTPQPPAVEESAPPHQGPDTEPDEGPDTEPTSPYEAGPGDETETLAALAAEASGVDAPTAPPPAVAPAPPPAGADPAGSSGVEADDHDGLTRAGAGAEDHSLPPTGIPGQPPAPSVTRPVALLLVSNGERVEVDRAILVGRAPEARRFSSSEQPRLLTVPSPLQEISSTHLEVRPGTGADHGSAVVTDMGSTNGTVLVQPGLGPEDLRPGVAVQLLPGSVINLGDGVTIQVTRPA